MENENAMFQKPKKMSMVAERELLKKLLKRWTSNVLASNMEGE